MSRMLLSAFNFFEVHCQIRDQLQGKKWPKITNIRFVCYRGKKK